MSSFRTHRPTGRTGLPIGTPTWFVQALGFVLIVVGALIDTAYHLWWIADDRRAGVGLIGHVVTLAGMVLTMAVVVAVGLRSNRRHQPSKGEWDAGCSTSAS
jgi:hypothetical protein